MNRVFLLIILALSFCVPPSCFADARFFSPGLFNDDDPLAKRDPLAARDEDGMLHQSAALNRTDFDPRYSTRSSYYCVSGATLTHDPAYVGAMQRDLRRLGYYCGPIDGIFSPEVSGAIARLQKNYSMTVTGTLTAQVRRALYLP